MKNTFIKYIIATVYRPLLIRHLSTTRRYAYKGIDLKIPPGVFHPKYFSSTKLLLHYITNLSVKGKSLLELGAGSGLISLWASREGAQVTATDINPLAIDYLKHNMSFNHQDFTIILSDMFGQIPVEKFDIIAINPPYYQKKPQSYSDYAWYCGENGEYFKALFSGLKDYIHAGSIICMVLCDGCNRNMISNLASQY
ncbi:MAG: methyltransferase, partial [Chitinophagaceae bacterium]